MICVNLFLYFYVLRIYFFVVSFVEFLSESLYFTVAFNSFFFYFHFLMIFSFIRQYSFSLSYCINLFCVDAYDIIFNFVWAVCNTRQSLRCDEKIELTFFARFRYYKWKNK